MIKQGGCRDGVGLFAAIKLHKHFSCGAGHAKAPFARVDIMTPCEEVGIEGWVMQQSLKNY